MKFSMAVEKKNAANLGQVSGHNERLHETASQQPKGAWFTPQGRHIVVPFRSDQLKKAKDLAKRKDAVLAIEVVLQVGNQSDWREFPTAEHPQGQPKAGSAANLNNLMRGAKEAAVRTFGAENIVSIVLHTDESTPHVHVVFTPIVEGKLQSKAWIGGIPAMVELRKNLHAIMEKHLPCTYTPGGPGGEPHDATKAAGAINGPQAPPATILEKASEAITGRQEIRTLRQAIEALNRQVQVLFSQLKRAQAKVSEAMTAVKAANEKTKAAALSEQKARREVELLQRRVKQLEPFEPTEKLVVKPVVTDGLIPRMPPRPSMPRPR